MAVDKLKPNDPRVESHTANLRGKTYKYILGKPEGTPRATVLLVHGWPDLGFAWRYQVPYLLSLGLQVVVPDVLGYGGTDAPQDVALYSLKSVGDDLAELARLVVGDGETIILGGHDWGGALVWRFALWHPELLRGVFSVCTPYSAPSARFLEYDEYVSHLPNFRYQIQLAGPDVEREIGSDPRKLRNFLAGLFWAKTPEGKGGFSTDRGVLLENLDAIGDSPLLDDEELQFYVKEYSRNGMRGPLNWYRTRKINFEEELALIKDGEKPRIKTPALIVLANNDIALPPRIAAGMDEHFDNLTKGEVDGTHWALWDSTELVNAQIGKFIESVLTGPSAKASI
ncbi:hypothetical protein SLS53_008919 [Cytospora paraplurivora]|uniref:AB hydrolase-1 domain-containing protein n=1 Tax=Cytospora paraplurivora TaxID=2898453 RepID=A0AAN9TXT4_9PEZI